MVAEVVVVVGVEEENILHQHRFDRPHSKRCRNKQGQLHSKCHRSNCLLMEHNTIRFRKFRNE